MRRLFGVLALALVAALAVTGCGNAANGSGSNSASGRFNDADVRFAQSMIPHHEQAVVMAKMAESHAASADVRDLAARIEAAQGPEIRMMSRWLRAWGEDVPAGGGMGGMGGMDHGSDEMPGRTS